MKRLLYFLSFLLISNTAFAADAEPGFIARLLPMLPMFIMVFGVFYLIVIMPQQKKMKEQQNLLANLTKGQEVVTLSGMIAKVASVEADFILLEIAPNVRIRVLKDQIDRLFEKK